MLVKSGNMIPFGLGDTDTLLGHLLGMSVNETVSMMWFGKMKPVHQILFTTKCLL